MWKSMRSKRRWKSTRLGGEEREKRITIIRKKGRRKFKENNCKLIRCV